LPLFGRVAAARDQRGEICNRRCSPRRRFRNELCRAVSRPPDNAHRRLVLSVGMPDATRLRKSAAHLFALCLTTKDKEWAIHLALRAADYLTEADEMERKSAAGPKPEKDEKDVEPA
jgi:hypothetical protein